MYDVFEKLWFSIQETDFIYVSLFEVFFCKRQRNHFSKDGISGCAHKHLEAETGLMLTTYAF